MAGHSKWANIKFRKAAQDAKRGKLFTKLIREITVAARMGGEESHSNPRLRDAIDKALKANMKRDTINNAIQRGIGAGEGNAYEELRYEGYGPSGVAILVDCLSDNRNRTVSDVRHAFNKNGGNLGTDGSVAYLFTQLGVLTFAPDTDEETLMEAAIEAGVLDVVKQEDGSFEATTTPSDFYQVKTILAEQGLVAAAATVSMEPETRIAVSGEDAEKLLRLVDMLEDLDDVQNVYFNATIDDEVYQRMEN